MYMGCADGGNITRVLYALLRARHGSRACPLGETGVFIPSSVCGAGRGDRVARGAGAEGARRKEVV